jgi:hypothetical protein
MRGCRLAALLNNSPVIADRVLRAQKIDRCRVRAFFNWVTQEIINVLTETFGNRPVRLRSRNVNIVVDHVRNRVVARHAPGHSCTRLLTCVL